MKKLRERLNKKGFTLVELIVVIVIILILAAVLVPNVMRYIDQANRAEAKSNAATALTELQGYEAEFYAAEDTDLDDMPPHCIAHGGEHDYDDFALTKIEEDNITVATNSSGAKYSTSSTLKPDSAKGNQVKFYAKDGVIEAFAYATKVYYINWTQSGGWDEIKTYN